MFEKNNRFITKRVAEEVSKEVQRLIWDILDSFISGREPDFIDYLQIFSLSVARIKGENMQWLIHRQEEPSFQEMAIFEVDQPIEATLYVYGEKELSTLMFSEDY
jgi:hypothetical protein